MIRAGRTTARWFPDAPAYETPEWLAFHVEPVERERLTNQEWLPLFVMMTCLTGYFHDWIR